MFIHHVFFWLKTDLNFADKERFKDCLHSLQEIPAIKASYIGIPASTSRDVIDTTYSYSLLLHFENGDDQEIYQTHPTHLEFVSQCSDLWEKVIVYDSVDLIQLL